MAKTVCEIIWLRGLLSNLGVQVDGSSELFCDNDFALKLAANPVFHERTKHIEVDCHFVREKVQDHIITTPYIRRSDQLADVFTKALPRGSFYSIISKLTSDDLYGST